MICKICGKFNPDDMPVCAQCGTPISQAADLDTQLSYAASISPEEPAAYPRRGVSRVPKEYKPLSPWAYVGYQLLFAIPLVGFILLIVFSCGGTSNLNLKNFARSYWCTLLIGLIVVALAALLLITLGDFSGFLRNFSI